MSTEDPRILVYQGNGNAPDFTGMLGTNVPKGDVVTTIDDADSLTETDSDADLAAHKSSLASLVDSSPNVITEPKGSFTVEDGTPALFGGVGDWQSGEIANTSLWMQDPNGNYVNTATNINDSEQVIIVPQQSTVDNAVLAFSIPNPTPGVWEFGMNYDENNTTSHLQYMASTIPKDGAQAMVQQYKLMYETGHQQSSSFATQSLSDSAKCTICKIIFYPIALAVLSIGAGVLATLTVDSALVVSLVALVAPYAAIPAAAVLALLVTLSTAALISVAYVLKEICEWVGLCDD